MVLENSKLIFLGRKDYLQKRDNFWKSWHPPLSGFVKSEAVNVLLKAKLEYILSSWKMPMIFFSFCSTTSGGYVLLLIFWTFVMDFLYNFSKCIEIVSLMISAEKKSGNLQKIKQNFTSEGFGFEHHLLSDIMVLRFFNFICVVSFLHLERIWEVWSSFAGAQLIQLKNG